MLKIFLVRHGQDLDNFNGILNGRRDEPLTEKGISQAKELGEKIKKANLSFVKIYSSPLQRAYKTAEIIGDALNLQKPEILEGLIERDFGIMTGQPHTKIGGMCAPDIIQTGTVTYFLNPKGSETFPQLMVRARKLLQEVEELHKDGNILLVTHGDFGKMMYAGYYGLDWQGVLRMFHFGNSEMLELSKESSPESSHVFRTEQYNL